MVKATLQDAAEVIAGKGATLQDAAQAIVDGWGSAGKDNAVNVTRIMPEASAEEAYRVYLYTGKTTPKYTHGYIYECTKDATYTATVTFDPATISCTGAQFINLVNEYVAAPEEIVSGTMTYLAGANLWLFIGKDSKGAETARFQIYQDDYEDAGWGFSGTPEDGDIVNFECSITEESAAYAWVRIQP